jgi:MYXO-CTERM domain-containing protein
MNLKRACAGCLVAASLAANASATIHYVDATDGAAGNTAVAPSAGGGVFNSVAPFGTQGPANDGLWDARAFANSATIYQNVGTGAGADNAQRLATSVSGLPLGLYSVFAYFWSDSSNMWRLRADLVDTSPGDLPLYMPGGAGVTQYYTGGDATVLSDTLAPNPFATPVMIAEGNRRLYQVALGQVNGTGFSVYVDDGPATVFNERSWYDGIGYERIPEPASGLLGAMALAAVGAVRRRRR